MRRGARCSPETSGPRLTRPPHTSSTLLPAFDPWVIGASRTANACLGEAYRDRVYRLQGWVSPVVLADGRMTGVWRHAVKGSRVLVEVTPFEPVATWVRRGVEKEAERLAEFLGGTLELRWS